MNEQLQAVSDGQRETWSRVSKAWKKWNGFTMEFLKPMGDAIIKALSLKPNDIVLDIASGTGEPAFSIAAIAKNGKVYATDLSEDMLKIARTYAHERKVNNIEFKVTDVSQLPFEEYSFDKISCRMGFMFFSDMEQAAKEMFRVCRSGGKVAISVWGAPENNDWYTTMTKVLSNYIEMPQSTADAPGVFRCENPALVRQLFEQAGFKNVNVESVSGTIDFGTAENYWLNRTELSESVVNLMRNVDEETRKKIKDDLLANCRSMLTNGRLIMNYAALIISGEK